MMMSLMPSLFKVIVDDVGIYPLELEAALVDEQHQSVMGIMAVFVPLFAPTGHVHQVVPVDVGIHEVVLEFITGT